MRREVGFALLLFQLCLLCNALIGSVLGTYRIHYSKMGRQKPVKRREDSMLVDRRR